MSEPSLIPLWLVLPRSSLTSGHSRLCRRRVIPNFFLEVTLFFAWGPFAQESSSPPHSWAPQRPQSTAPPEHPHPPEAPRETPGLSCPLCSLGAEWDRTLPEKQLEGGEREGQETGLTEGGGGQLHGVGAFWGGCLWRAGGRRLVARSAPGRPAPLGAGSGAHRLSTNQEHMQAPGQLWEARLLPARASGAPDRLRTSERSCLTSHSLSPPPQAFVHATPSTWMPFLLPAPIRGLTTFCFLFFFFGKLK